MAVQGGQAISVEVRSSDHSQANAFSTGDKKDGDENWERPPTHFSTEQLASAFPRKLAASRRELPPPPSCPGGCSRRSGGLYVKVGGRFSRFRLEGWLAPGQACPQPLDSSSQRGGGESSGSQRPLLVEAASFELSKLLCLLPVESIRG